MGAIQKKIGNKVKQFRLERDLSQEKFAELAKVDFTTINRIENGKINPSIKTIEKIAKALKVSPKDLL